jgi:hypothetical protein
LRTAIESEWWELKHGKYKRLLLLTEEETRRLTDALNPLHLPRSFIVLGARQDYKPQTSQITNQEARVLKTWKDAPRLRLKLN